MILKCPQHHDHAQQNSPLLVAVCQDMLVRNPGFVCTFSWICPLMLGTNFIASPLMTIASPRLSRTVHAS